MNYLNKLSYDFVREFGVKLGLKNFHVRHDIEGWHINFDLDEQAKNNLLISNFLVQSHLGKDFCEKTTQLWQIEMYKLFGKKYLKDLKEYKLFELRIKQQNEKRIIKSNLNKIAKQALEK